MRPRHPASPRIAAVLWVACVVLAGGCNDVEAPPNAESLPGNTWLHVATTGYADAAGTPQDPLSYPGQAIARAWREGYRGVRIAAGVYPWQVFGLPVRIYGGVDIVGGCDPLTWEAQPGAYTELEGTGAAILAVGVDIPTHVSGLSLSGPPPGGFRDSSVALHLENCGPDLVFAGCRFVARNGFGFPDRATDATLRDPSTAGTPGADATCGGPAAAGGGGGNVGPCGGPGGDGGRPGEPGADGADGCWINVYPVPGGSPGQDGQEGRDGQDGQNGAPGEPGTGLGRIALGTVHGVAGANGRSGNPGTGGAGGGGGGGALTGGGGGGGGGGAGGMGGGGGSGGHGGGHTIAVVSIHSLAAFAGCRFVTGDGGRGQDGGHGATGQAGAPGAGGGAGCGGGGNGGDGGSGGDGGDGGGGGGGNGGHAYGLLIVGAETPVIDDACTYAIGAAGGAGIGGLGGDGTTRASDGEPGQSAPIRIMNENTKGGIDD